MTKKLVAILLGSDSDLPVVKLAAAILDELAAPYDLTIASAHRSPQRVRDFVHLSVEKGIEVFIVAAGGAAHLPGVVAAETILPVIGVPIETPSLKGVDSLYSIVQMPAGVPVATMAIGSAGAKNSALFAVQILALKYPKYKLALERYRLAMVKGIEEKAEQLRKLGVERYLEKSNIKNQISKLQIKQS
ncbi:MAG: 5-(carboxyamino)imidazole ribonucleotide mutase [Elusimicrobiota bacterium]